MLKEAINALIKGKYEQILCHTGAKHRDEHTVSNGNDCRAFAFFVGAEEYLRTIGKFGEWTS